MLTLSERLTLVAHTSLIQKTPRARPGEGYEDVDDDDDGYWDSDEDPEGSADGNEDNVKVGIRAD
jgi:hypothetical protein